LAVVLVKGNNPWMKFAVVGSKQVGFYRIAIRHPVAKMKTDDSILVRAIQDLDIRSVQGDLETDESRYLISAFVCHGNILAA
jgi:hypothetical protein